MANSSPTLSLFLNELEHGFPGLPPTWGAFLCCASRVCFEYKKHPRGVGLRVFGVGSPTCNIFWEGVVTQDDWDAWGDEQELAEFGACGVAILLAMKLTGYTAIKRARKYTGVDYWLGHRDGDKPFQGAARLEISGILIGHEKITTRVEKKLKQTNQSDDTALPTYIAVVDFREPVSSLLQK